MDDIELAMMVAVVVVWSTTMSKLRVRISCPVTQSLLEINQSNGQWLWHSHFQI